MCIRDSAIVVVISPKIQLTPLILEIAEWHQVAEIESVQPDSDHWVLYQVVVRQWMHDGHIVRHLIP